MAYIEYSEDEKRAVVNMPKAAYLEAYRHLDRTPASRSSIRQRLQAKGEYEQYVDEGYDPANEPEPPQPLYMAVEPRQHREQLLGNSEQLPQDKPFIVGVRSDEPPDLDELIARHKRHYDRIHKTHERKHQQHVYLPGATAMITLFSDQHFGSPHADLERALEEQRMVMAIPNSYSALGGDLFDNYVIGKLAAQNMNHTVTVSEEVAIAKHYMANFGDRLLWVHSGNHPQWSTKLIGIDIDRSITPAGVLYDADEILVNVHVGPHSYLIRSRHKWSGNSIHNPTHGMERAARFDNSAPDIFIGGHVHKGAIVRNFILAGRKKTAILTGTYKGTSDTYARQEGFAANDGSTAVSIIFFPDGTYHAFDNVSAACQVMRALQRQAA